MSPWLFSLLALVDGVLCLALVVWKGKEFGGRIVTTIAGIGFIVVGCTGVQISTTIMRIVLVSIPILFTVYAVADKFEKQKDAGDKDLQAGLDIVTSVHQNSHDFVPAFALIPKAAVPGLYSYPPLDFHYRMSPEGGIAPQPGAQESKLGSWPIRARCLFSTSEDGHPLRRQPGEDTVNSRVIPLFDGTAELLVTDRRLMGVVQRGGTMLGDVGGGTAHVLIFALPLGAIDHLRMDLNKDATGRQLQITGMFPLFQLEVISVVLGPMRGILDRVTDAVAAQRRGQRVDRPGDGDQPEGDVMLREDKTDSVSVTFG